MITIIGRTLEGLKSKNLENRFSKNKKKNTAFDEDKKIDVFGFGDSETKGDSVFPFYQNKPCIGLAEVLLRYTAITPTRTLSGPTNFAPLIKEAIKIVKKKRDYHILLIITDGDVVSKVETGKFATHHFSFSHSLSFSSQANAIVEASSYPLSIVCVGVGDGPFDLMASFPFFFCKCLEPLKQN